jgi:hypothetical protein
MKQKQKKILPVCKNDEWQIRPATWTNPAILRNDLKAISKQADHLAMCCVPFDENCYETRRVTLTEEATA